MMTARLGGWAGWLMRRLHTARRERPRLELVERITIGPRQTVALIEADGRRLLVACAAAGEPAIVPLGSEVEARVRELAIRGTQRKLRVSW
jgi:flagellar biogenesis protein FliO